MIPLQQLREQPDVYREGARRKRMSAPVEEILGLDERARVLRSEMEETRARQNVLSKGLRGRPGDAELAELNTLKQRIQELNAEVGTLEAHRDALLLEVPNPPDASVPDGDGPEDSVVIREWGDETPQTPPHWEIGDRLGIFDWERAAKLSGSRFAVLLGEGARLERALATWFVECAVAQGNVEVSPPLLVRREAMLGTGQLPKFEDDAFSTGDDLFLSPTAEVPLTNLYREEILDRDRLPIRHVAWTPCFRREAGAAGRDTRGFIRLHQFEKVELVRLVEPETSGDELEQLVADAEHLLRQLGLRHRVLLLCSGDMGFTQARTYDLEVWSPGLQRWLEVSSCSNCADFQARRAEIRYRPAAGERPRYVHTLNGSALALPRVIAALLESGLQEDGSVEVPEVLEPYMAGIRRLSAPL